MAAWWDERREELSEVTKRPKRSSELFEFLFGSGPEQAFRRLSEGVIAMLDNAEAILDDAALLVESRSFARASFLIATAEEEMGKAYILLDMCRVDARQEHVLRHLCSSFYNHVLKYVYLDYSANQYGGIQELSQLHHYFRVGANQWWPSDPESGEPDMPHETYFLREANLYVDVDTYAHTWVAPGLPALEMRFLDVSIPTPLKKAREILSKLRATQDYRLYEPKALHLFNDAMKRLRVNEKTPMSELCAAYQAAGKKLEEFGVSVSDFESSELHNWPMYWIKL